MCMVPLSVLDLAPIVEGGDVATALAASRALALDVERLGYRRFWIAEHHGMPGIASAATSLCIAHVASATKTIRVGAGGIMLPNHAPLVIAEQFGTLEALFPGRIDLGLGRAPGSDAVTAYALRRDPHRAAESFPDDVVELRSYFQPGGRPGRVRAVPGEGLDVPLWILGSSLFGAQLAAALGLPYAFASHFAPAQLEEAIALYRRRFQPSAQLDAPYVMLAVNVFGADTLPEARRLATSIEQAFVALRRGTPGQLAPPRGGYRESLGPADRAVLDHALDCSFSGPEDALRRGMQAFVERTGADELIVTAPIHDPAARLRSLELAAAAAA